jgi:hypothetical protein
MNKDLFFIGLVYLRLVYIVKLKINISVSAHPELAWIRTNLGACPNAPYEPKSKFG